MTTSTPEHDRLFDRILGLFGRHEQDQTSAQPQRAALLDLLVWTMFADRYVAIPEQAFIRERAEGLTWTSPSPVELHVDRAVRRAREVLGDVAAGATYLDEIATRLGDDATRRAAYEACQELIGVDGERSSGHKAELAHLERVRRGLGLVA